MRLLFGNLGINLDAVAVFYNTNATNPATQKTEPAVRLVLTDARHDPIHLFGQDADDFRAYVAANPSAFTVAAARPPPAAVVTKAATPPTAPTTTVKP